jgi:adenylate cyclase
MRRMFQSMVTPKVVDAILKKSEGIELGGEEKEVTVLFSDIRGFTSFSEQHKPQEVVSILNEYLPPMTETVYQTDGTLERYIGDAIMAFWGAPVAQQDHAQRACITALGMADLLHQTLHPKWEREGREKLRIGIGLNSGNVVVGFIGTESIKNYALVGDTVNLGSRLEGATKEYRVEIILSETTYEKVKDDFLCRELDLIRVKGKARPIRIYELINRRLKDSGVKEKIARVFERGLAHYRGREWDQAVGQLKIGLGWDPEDGPSQLFIERCGELKKNPPPPDWDGVFEMKTK